MPDTTNVRPLNELLAQAYGIPIDEAAARFGVGKLQGLRSRIVHAGERLPIHADLANYVRALFADCLNALLTLPSPAWAESYMRDPVFTRPFDLDRLCHINR